MKDMILGLASLMRITGRKKASMNKIRNRKGSIRPRELLEAEIYASGPTYAFARTAAGENVFLPGDVKIVDDELDWYAVRPGRKIALRVKPDARGRDMVATLVLFLEDKSIAA